MSKRFANRVVVTVNGVFYGFFKRVNVRTQTGNDLVQGMTHDGNPAGHILGGKNVSLDIDAYIPANGIEPDWENLVDGVITKFDAHGGSPKKLYTGVLVTEVADSFEETGKGATRRISAKAIKAVSL